MGAKDAATAGAIMRLGQYRDQEADGTLYRDGGRALAAIAVRLADDLEHMLTLLEVSDRNLEQARGTLMLYQSQHASIATWGLPAGTCNARCERTAGHSGQHHTDSPDD